MNIDSRLAELQQAVQQFCEARDWDQFHGQKDLAIGLVTEASELLEHFRFLSAEECDARLMDRRTDIEIELADIFFFLLRFAQLYEVDLGAALARNLERNDKRYPVEKARGSNKKHTDF